MPRGKGPQPIRSAQWHRTWRPAADEVGIPVGLHCLRHYYATLLIHHGKSVKTVQAALGHANPMITLNLYAGHWPETAGHIRSVVNEEMGTLAHQVAHQAPPVKLADLDASIAAEVRDLELDDDFDVALELANGLEDRCVELAAVGM